MTKRIAGINQIREFMLEQMTAVLKPEADLERSKVSAKWASQLNNSYCAQIRAAAVMLEAKKLGLSVAALLPRLTKK